MKTYMLLFYGLEFKPDSVTSEDYAKSWQDWIAALEATGNVLSSLPFEWSGKKVTGASSEDLALDAADAGGYMLVKAESIDAATEIAKGAPHMVLGGTTIVRPCVEGTK
ncbi:MAG: hypothetical protein JWN50_754 [Parcubacteria group bacterium]|nr:hypothetical protein [Parcubacteria group bacterium]